MNDLMSTSEIASVLGCHCETVRRMIRSQRLPNVIKIGAGYRISPEDLQKFVDSRKVNNKGGE